MEALHRRYFTEADNEIYRIVGESLAAAGTTEVRLDKGSAHAQKISNRCAAAASWNALETCDDRWPDFPDVVLPTPEQIYLTARAIDDFKEHEAGTTAHAAAEAACRLIGHGIRWMELPLDAQVMAAWIATERTGIVYGTQWTASDNVPGNSRVLIPTGAFSPAGHAVHLFGFKARHTYRRNWFSRRKTTAVFLTENSHQFPELEYYYPAERVAVHGISAIVFIPPSYGNKR